MPTRRRFLGALAGVSAAAAAWPGRLEALALPLAARGAGWQEDEPFWALVRREFMIPEGRLFLNPATLGPQPRVVVAAVMEHTRRTAETYPPAADWEGLKGRVGALIGADPAGLVFPRNTTEAMSFVANGLDLGAGDEVLTTDHEHIGGLCCWELLAARRGLVLKQLPLPVPATSGEEIVALFREAITSRTRVISFSHVTFTNGTILPVRALAGLCRERGLICVVDGAHPPGMMRVDLAALGPIDFYASSPHKWLGAAQGTGLLWMAEPWRTRLWPTLASGGWDDLSLGAHRFNHLGTLDESRLAGLDAAVGLHRTIGPGRIERRNRFLRRRLHGALAALPRVRIASPDDETLVAGMVSFRVDGIEALDLQRRLAERANVRTRVVSEYGYGWMRLAPHIYNTVEEIDRVVALIADEVG
ncbi:MAG TPA: aminotransferase class V-fold PLP-dependent enzyme [Longimicrobiales bacterium]|nr:aminotransferase class V-fold PLP-dependent enzyme [Longimicrobiales bacterium]